jgi:hypothetical protein
MVTLLEKNQVKWFETPYGQDSMCSFCGSSVHWEDCDQCGGTGYNGHECGEDTCCCLYPEDNVTCDYCDGKGGHYHCLGDCHRQKPKPIKIAAEAPGQTKLDYSIAEILQKWELGLIPKDSRVILLIPRKELICDKSKEPPCHLEPSTELCKKCPLDTKENTTP